MFFISAILTLAGGLFLSLQSPTNAALAKHTGNLPAAAISFGVATVLLFPASLLFGSGSLSSVVQADWWMLLGGIYGGFLVFMVTTSVPVLGIALTLAFSMSGQLFMGIIIDLFGLLRMDRIPFRPILAAGCALMAAGIILVCRSRREEGMAGSAAGSENSSRKFLLGAMTFLSGMGSAVQAPTNVALASLTGRVEASFFSFTGGFIALSLAALLLHRRAGGPESDPARSGGIRLWMLAGGVYGAAIVLFTIIATPYLGVALVLGISMIGQLAGALLIDTFGLLQTRRIALNHLRLLGILLFAAGVIAIAAGRL